MGTQCPWFYPLSKHYQNPLLVPEATARGDVCTVQLWVPTRLRGQRGGSRPQCQPQMADTRLPEAALQSAHPCALSTGQLGLKGDEVIKVPLFTLPKRLDEPVWSTGYPTSCFFANNLNMLETLHNPAIIWKLSTGQLHNYTWLASSLTASNVSELPPSNSGEQSKPAYPESNTKEP